MTAKKSVAAVTTKVYDLLQALEPEERVRAIAAAQALLGTPIQIQQPLGTEILNRIPGGTTAQAYFAERQPASVSEALAVGARYRELNNDAMDHTKDDFKAVFKDARRSFDSKNFGRDVGNARASGFFTRSKELSLADYGQRFVDALPDRAATKALKRGAKKKAKGKKHG